MRRRTFLLSSSLFYAVACGGAANDESTIADESAVTTLTAAARPRPPTMGWNTWNRFRCDYDEAMILAQADALVASGMRDAGYDTVVLDDCWQGRRDDAGHLTADANKFPRGMKALGDALHARGLRFGIYTAAGAVTCQWRPGSWGHEHDDARTFASWGVDYVKDDWCWHAAALEITGALAVSQPYATMHDALAESGRSIVLAAAPMGASFAVAIEPKKFVGEWAPSVSDEWRVAGDITPDWAGVMRGLVATNDWAAAASPGHYNDPDMLEVGNEGLDEVEARAHFSMWAMASAPLVAGNDLLSMTEATRAILTRREVIAVDRDPRGIQGTKVLTTAEGVEVWSKPLDGEGVRAVALFNPTETTASASVSWPDVGLADAAADVDDLWTGAIINGVRNRQVSVPRHGVVMLRVRGREPAAPVGDAWLSDQTFTYAANHWGVVERDASVGGRAAHDGRPLRMGGRTYEKGVGVHAPSDLRVRLDGRCHAFDAEVGVDDETLVSGSVSFEVWAEGTLLASSGVRTRGSAMHLHADLTGRRELRLVTHGGPSVDFDHADWAAAKLHCQ